MEVSDEMLRAAVAANRSWRGVLRAVGATSPRTGRELKARCDLQGIDYGHFGAGGRSDQVIVDAVCQSSSWPEALAAAGYARDSGSARAQIRRRCARLAVSVEHLSAGPPRIGSPLLAPGRSSYLSSAAPMLVAGRFTLAGHRVMWPLEPAPYDLVVQDGRTAHRVQVKSTTVKDGGSWYCMLTHSTYDSAKGRQVRDVYTSDEVDAFALVDGDLEVYVLPHEVVAGLTGVTLRRYEDYRLPHLAPGQPSASL